MRLGMSMIQTHELSQRQILEQRLEQKLTQQLKLEISLSQYLKHEDEIEGLIRWASENEKWERFNKDGFDFQYAKLPYKVAKPIADIAGPGFAHCHYNVFEEMFMGSKYARSQGDWSIFVVEDRIPKDLIDFVALHERGEELSTGNHYFASKLEFGYVAKRKKISPYIKFIDSKFPSKFVDLTQEVLFPILPFELIDILKKQGTRHETELESAEKLIDEFPLPYSILQKMDKYEKLTERVCNELTYSVGAIQKEIMQLDFNQYYQERLSEKINNLFKKTFFSISSKDLKIIPSCRINQTWIDIRKLINETLLNKADKVFVKIPTSFYDAYDSIKGNKTAVKPRYSKEEKNKMRL